jgi:hypothetical protein
LIYFIDLAHLEAFVQEMTASQPGYRRRLVREWLALTGAGGESLVGIVPGGSGQPYGVYAAEDFMAAYPDLEADATALLRLSSISGIGQFGSDELISYIQAPEMAGDLMGTVQECLREVVPATRASRVVLLPMSSASEYGIYRRSELEEVLGQLSRASDLDERLRALPSRRPIHREAEPWQVVVRCPYSSSSDKPHRVTFTGVPGPQPPTIYGIPSTDRQEVLEDAVKDDLNPRKSLDRTQDQLKRILEGQALVTAALAGFGWLSGGIDRVVRELPGWYGFTISVIVFSFVLAVVGYVVGTPHRVNPEDLVQVRRSYTRRQEWATAFAVAATSVFGLGLVLAVFLPAKAADRALQMPAPAVSFEGASLPTTATIEVEVDNVAADTTITLEVVVARSDVDLRPPVLLRATGEPGVDGRVTFKTKLALTRGGPWLSAVVFEGDGDSPVCTRERATSGCTVVSLPPRARSE